MWQAYSLFRDADQIFRDGGVAYITLASGAVTIEATVRPPGNLADTQCLRVTSSLSLPCICVLTTMQVSDGGTDTKVPRTLPWLAVPLAALSRSKIAQQWFHPL